MTPCGIFLVMTIGITMYKASSTSSSNLRHTSLFQEKLPTSQFLGYVAQAKYHNTDNVLRLLSKDKAQELLLSKGVFTDYSGRKFNCSAYEAAYWYNDVRMCRLLESHMNEATRAEMHRRCQSIDSKGLDYSQHGQEKNSSHFNLEPLKSALKTYAYGLDQWIREGQSDKIKEAWLQIGKTQGDLPANVVLEYCTLNGRFDPVPNFDELEVLLENMTFECEKTKKEQKWFPIDPSQTEGLGISFSLYKGSRYGLPMSCSNAGQVSSRAIKSDYAAIVKLDKVRTADMQQSLENLSRTELSKGY